MPDRGRVPRWGAGLSGAMSCGTFAVCPYPRSGLGSPRGSGASQGKGQQSFWSLGVLVVTLFWSLGFYDIGCVSSEQHIVVVLNLKFDSICLSSTIFSQFTLNTISNICVFNLIILYFPTFSIFFMFPISPSFISSLLVNIFISFPYFILLSYIFNFFHGYPNKAYYK